MNPYDLAVDLKDRVAAFLIADGVDVPKQQYVAPGDSTTIAYDGPALMVNIDQLFQGQPGQDRSQTPTFGQVMHSARFSITILRDAAVMDDSGTAPPTTAIQADAKVNIGDLWSLQRALEDVKARSQQPGGWVGPGVPVVLGPVVPVGPMGAAVAAVGSIQAMVL